jgi:DNA-binding PadR family transcriptional regulator
MRFPFHGFREGRGHGGPEGHEPHEFGPECDGPHDRRFMRGGFGFGGPGPHHHGRGGRLGRFFAHGDLHFVVLHLIAEKPRHGYEIIKAIEETVGGAYTPSPGTIYPTLTMLEEQGYATVEASDGGKKLYSVTEAGQAYLAANAAPVQALLARMKQAGSDRDGRSAPQIVRAIENLRMALHLKTSQGGLTEEQLRAIADTLDDAARAIERA